MTELGDIELSVPRTRRFSALTVVRAYARRAGHIDRMILACFVLRLSTRKVATALAPVSGRISAGTVSQVAKTLDGAVAAFHAGLCGPISGTAWCSRARPGPGRCARCWWPWGSGRTRRRSSTRPLAESAAQWEQFLTDLFRRGLEGGRLEMVCVDAAGLLAALPKRCWAHKIRNVLDKVRKADRDDTVGRSARRDERHHTVRRAPFRRPSTPKPSLRNDLDELLTCWR